jgi:diguanylate cyclase (GGDEF)-like protein
MMARGEALGVLHVQMTRNGATTKSAAAARTIANVAALAASISEYVALAVANQMLRGTLRNQAIRDPLTGLFNRRYAEETLEREIHRAARRQTSLGVIFLDVDHFKAFNDTYGHDAGDLVLQSLGVFLRAHIRIEDVACRYGGEEFLIIMSDVSLEIARQRAEILREGAKEVSLNHKGQPLGQVTLSLGVATFPKAGTTKETLLRAADAALYQAKTKGRNCVIVANEIEEPEPEQASDPAL